MPKQLITEMNTNETEDHIPKADVIIIPLGAEQKEHGPHLCYNTDYVMANKLRDLILERMPNVLASATIGSSFFPAFTEYAGSLSMEVKTATDMLVQTCRNLKQQGAKCFYFLNTGISTIKVLDAAKEDLGKDNISISYFNFNEFENTTDIKSRLKIDEIGTHAGDFETSMMLYLTPERVDMSKAVDNDCPHKPGGLTRNTNSIQGIISVSGIWGKPRSATKEKGQFIVSTLVGYLENEIKKFVQSQKN